MVERDNDTIRAVAWSEVFPWLKLARAFRTAITARALVLGAVGILLTAVGWGIVGVSLGTDTYATHWLKPFAANPWLAVTDKVPDVRPSLAAAPHVSPMQGNPVSATWSELSGPAIQGLTYTGLSVRAVVSVLLCGVWAVAVWAVFGAAICRIAAVDMAAAEQVGLVASLRYAVSKWPSYVAAPLLPVALGVVLPTIPIIVLGWIMPYDYGLLLAGILWPLVLVAGLLMALVLLGLLFGWPLMWGTISAEGTDSFDALSRSYAYTFQRPLHYLFYAAVAGFIGWLGWLLVSNFAAGVVWLGLWAPVGEVAARGLRRSSTVN